MGTSERRYANYLQCLEHVAYLRDVGVINILYSFARIKHTYNFHYILDTHSKFALVASGPVSVVSRTTAGQVPDEAAGDSTTATAPPLR